MDGMGWDEERERERDSADAEMGVRYDKMDGDGMGWMDGMLWDGGDGKMENDD